MKRLRPRTTVVSGATIGLIAGAAVYGAISSSASSPTPTSFKPVSASVAVAPANCGAGQKLEHGVCIVHVVHTVIRPAAAGESNPNSDTSTSTTQATKPAEHEGTNEGEHEGTSEAEHGDDAAEAAHEAAEHAKEAAEHSVTSGS